MKLRPSDPLLATARFVLGIVTLASAAFAVSMVLAIPVVFAIRDQVLAFLAANGAPPEAIWGVMAVLLLSAVAAVLGFFFFRHLYRIIDTVAAGDAFTLDNARRLAAMAWISVAVHVLAIPLAIVSDWLAQYSDRFEVNPGVSFAGILLALVLFVLARVFREGTRMREDLEGTV